MQTKQQRKKLDYAIYLVQEKKTNTHMMSLAFKSKLICFGGQFMQIWNLPSLKIQDPVPRN